MDNEVKAQDQTQVSVTFVLTLAQANSILQILHTAPYNVARPLIEELMSQAQTQTPVQHNAPAPVPASAQVQNASPVHQGLAPSVMPRLNQN